MNTDQHSTTERRGPGPVALGFIIGDAAAIVGIILGVAISALVVAARGETTSGSSSTGAIVVEVPATTSSSPGTDTSLQPSPSAQSFAQGQPDPSWIVLDGELTTEYEYYSFATATGTAEITLVRSPDTAATLLAAHRQYLDSAATGWKEVRVDAITSDRDYEIVAMTWTWNGTTQCSMIVASGTSAASLGASGSAEPCAEIEAFALSIEFTDE